MRSPSTRYYLYCQAIGWGAIAATFTLFNLFILHTAPNKWMPYQAEFILPGLLVTHLLRYFIRRRHWLDLPLRRSLTRLVPALFLALTAAALIRSAFPRYPHLPKQVLAHISEYSLVILPWLILYVMIHQIRYARENTKRKEHLEHLVKEQQSPTAGPVIDLEDLTGALDRIRSLIDTDPNSARREITTFSRLLRSGHFKS